MSPDRIGHHRLLCNLAVGAAVLLVMGVPFMPLPGWTVVASFYLGTAAAVFGCAHYAMSKGHHPAWGLVASLMLLGVLMLLVPLLLLALPNRHASAHEPDEHNDPVTNEPQP